MCTCGRTEVTTRPALDSPFFAPVMIRVCVRCDLPVSRMQSHSPGKWIIWQRKAGPYRTVIYPGRILRR